MRTITIILMLSSIVAWIAWDVFLGTKGAETESQLIAKIAHASILLPFIVGFWTGHLFGNRNNPGSSSFLYGLPIFLMLAIFDLTWHFESGIGMPWSRYPALWLVLGIPAGSLLWGQSFQSF